MASAGGVDVTRTHYELLDLPRTASPDDVKRAFRREIARYHPDKVQHLGTEFQEIAAAKAADLTQAYRTLSDPALRVEYDATLDCAGGEHPGREPCRPAEPETESTAAAAQAGDTDGESGRGAGSAFTEDRAGASDLVRRAIGVRFRQALEDQFGRWQATDVDGFDIACVPQKAGVFGQAPPRVLVRCVPDVNGPAVVEAWRMAARMREDRHRDLCVFLVGPSLAPVSELAEAISEQRGKRMPGGAKLTLVPVDARKWRAHVPADASATVKLLLARVTSA